MARLVGTYYQAVTLNAVEYTPSDIALLFGSEYGQAFIRPVVAPHQNVECVQGQMFHNGSSYFGCRRRGYCNDRRATIPRVYLCNLTVCQTKCVIPIADTVRLVDGEQPDVQPVCPLK